MASMMDGGGGSARTAAPFFNELKKQASFFLRDKLKTARLALTDATAAQLLAEEATAGDPWSPAPDARTMGIISRAAFEIDDYWRIVEILHDRISRYDRKRWREAYHALILLEHLLIHGPESVAGEFHGDKAAIEELGTLQLVDERGFNWGFTVRVKTERVLKLLEKGTLLKEERERSRKVSRGIEGFGSFSQSHSPAGSELSVAAAGDRYGRSHSHYEDFPGQEQPKLCRPEAELRSWEVEAKPMASDRNRRPEVELQREEEEEDHPFSSFGHNGCAESLLLPSQS